MLTDPLDLPEPEKPRPKAFRPDLRSEPWETPVIQSTTPVPAVSSEEDVYWVERQAGSREPDSDSFEARQHDGRVWEPGLKPGTEYHVNVNGGEPTVMTTQAEEPIEDRLRRAWLNGFKEGVDRSAFAATEATGRWDY